MRRKGPGGRERKNMGTKNPVVLCDDLTGAMDAGSVLLEDGIRAVVTVRRADGGFPRLAGPTLIDMETRNVPASEAFAAVAARMHDGDIRYIKVDSTLRGPVAATMRAALAARPGQMIVFAPALPRAGRRTKHGVQYVNGKPLEETEFAADPFAPAARGDILRMLEPEIPGPVETMDLAAVRGGSLFSRFASMCGKGVRVAVADAETDGDLRRIAAAVEKGEKFLLPCGSAGLLGKISLPAVGEGPTRCLPSADGPVLVISGSPGAATRRQIAAAEKAGIPVLPLALAGEAGRWLRVGQSVIVDGAGLEREQIGARAGHDAARIWGESLRIRRQLAESAKRLIQEIPLAGLMLIGGETAASVLAAGGADVLRLTSLVEPYVPAALVEGGAWDGLRVVTKAGGLGTDEVICRAAAALRGKAYR